MIRVTIKESDHPKRPWYLLAEEIRADGNVLVPLDDGPRFKKKGKARKACRIVEKALNAYVKPRSDG